MSAQNVSEDWDEAAYWAIFAREAKRRSVVRECYVCDDPDLCGCGVADGPLDREEGLIERALSTLRRAVRAA